MENSELASYEVKSSLLLCSSFNMHFEAIEVVLREFELFIYLVIYIFLLFSTWYAIKDYD